MGSMSEWAANLIRLRARRAATLRRQNTLLGSPVLAAPVSPGAITTSVRAASGRLSGRVVNGSRFTIAGVSGTYTVVSDAQTPASGILVLSFAPAIPVGQSAAAGAAVTFTQKYFDISYPVLSRDTTAIDEKGVETGQTVRILPYEVDKPAPQQQDLLDGAPITRVQTIDADDGVAYYRCYIDTGAAS